MESLGRAWQGAQGWRGSQRTRGQTAGVAEDLQRPDERVAGPGKVPGRLPQPLQLGEDGGAGGEPAVAAGDLGGTLVDLEGRAHRPSILRISASPRPGFVSVLVGVGLLGYR